MDKIERFQQAYDYLYSSGAYHSKTDLANKLGRTRENVSGAYHGRSPFFNDSFLRAFCEKFPEINQEWLIYGNGEMIGNEQAAEPTEEYQAIPKWADSLIQLVASQTQTIEELRRELATIKDEIQNLKNKR